MKGYQDWPLKDLAESLSNRNTVIAQRQSLSVQQRRPKIQDKPMTGSVFGTCFLLGLSPSNKFGFSETQVVIQACPFAATFCWESSAISTGWIKADTEEGLAVIHWSTGWWRFWVNPATTHRFPLQSPLKKVLIHLSRVAECLVPSTALSLPTPWSERWGTVILHLEHLGWIYFPRSY